MVTREACPGWVDMEGEGRSAYVGTSTKEHKGHVYLVFISLRQTHKMSQFCGQGRLSQEGTTQSTNVWWPNLAGSETGQDNDLEGLWGYSRPGDWKGPPGVQGPWITRLCVFLSALLPAHWLGWVLSRLLLLRKLPKCCSGHTHTDPPLAGDQLRESQPSSHLLIALFRWPFLRRCVYWDGSVWNWSSKKQKLKRGSSTDGGALLWEPGSHGWPAQLPRASLPRRAHGWPAFEGVWVVPVSMLTASAGAPRVTRHGRGKEVGLGGCSPTALTSILQSHPK